MSKQEKVNLVELRINEKEINEVALNAKTVLANDNNIIVTAEQAIPTIAYAFIKCLMQKVAENRTIDENYEVDFASLFTIGVAYSEREDGEKEGNFVPYLIPGQEFKLAIKSDEDTEE